MNTWTWFSLFYLFVIIAISQIFIEEKLRLVFLLVMFLLYVSIYNIYFNIKYYVKIRNEPGIRGDRGDMGVQGQDGSDGVCTMAKSCGIATCRKLIVDELKRIFPEYRVIRDKLSKHTELNSKEKKQLRQINNYIDILIPKCENFQPEVEGNSVEEFKRVILDTLPTPS